MSKKSKKTYKSTIRAGEFRDLYHKSINGTKKHPILTTKVKKKAKSGKKIEYISFTHSKFPKINKKRIKTIALHKNPNLNDIDKKTKKLRTSRVVPLVQKDKPGKFGKYILPMKIRDRCDKSTIDNIKKHRK